MTQKVHGRLIPRLEQVGDGKSYGVFKFEDPERLPLEFPEGKVLTISNWCTLVYVETSGGDSFKVLDHHGKPLKPGEEYLIINPKY